MRYFDVMLESFAGLIRLLAFLFGSTSWKKISERGKRPAGQAGGNKFSPGSTEGAPSALCGVGGQD